MGVKAANAGIKDGACKAIKMHNTLLKQVSLGFNSPIVSAKRRYRALSRITCRHMSATLEAIQMNKAKTITFTKTQSDNGVAAIKAGEAAEVSRLKFFKSIKRKVTIDNIDAAKPAFESIAYTYYDKKHELNGALIEAITEGKLKETTKIGSLTIRQHKENIRKRAVRWKGYYSQWQKTGVVAKHGGKGTKKRATKGAVQPKGKKSVDKVELNQPPETTPVKRAIEQVSSIPRTILMETNWRHCGEGLRQEIEIAAEQLVALLSKIK